MKKKIFGTTLFMSCLSLLAGIALVIGILYGHFSELMLNELSDEARYIAAGIRLSGSDYLKDLQVADSTKRITLISSDGTVIFDSEADINTMDNHADREEFIVALQKGEGNSVRYSSTLSTKTIYYALRLSDNSILRTAYTQSTIWSLILGILPQMLLILAAVVLISILISWFLSKRIAKPIVEIDLEHPDIKEGYDEIIPLIKKINNQNDKINSQIAEIKHNQKEFKAITENMNEGLLVTDKSGKLLSYNNAALTLLNSEAPAENSSVFTLNRSEALRIAVEEALSDKHSLGKLQTDNSCYQIIANPVHEKGVVTGTVILIMDVTEKENHEQMRREFTSNVSHELKTPLTSISGMSELLMSGIVSKEDTMDFGRSIHEESARLVTLVNDIIKLSQLDEGIIPAPVEKVDLYSLSEEILARFKSTAAKRDITLRITGETAFVDGVRIILDEMISNLCDNAIKYNKDSGSVTVDIASNEHNVTLSVSDTGIGIPKEHHNRVFERFYRVDKSHSKQIGGTGLGLSIVKHAAMFHDAAYNIDSTVDKGTTITITFKKP